MARRVPIHVAFIILLYRPLPVPALFLYIPYNASSRFGYYGASRIQSLPDHCKLKVFSANGCISAVRCRSVFVA